MDANTAVALFLTCLMIVLCATALIGGHMVDKKRKAGK
jgi:uncharacterized membrane protein